MEWIFFKYNATLDWSNFEFHWEKGVLNRETEYMHNLVHVVDASKIDENEQWSS